MQKIKTILIILSIISLSGCKDINLSPNEQRQIIQDSPNNGDVILPPDYEKTKDVSFFQDKTIDVNVIPIYKYLIGTLPSTTTYKIKNNYTISKNNVTNNIINTKYIESTDNNSKTNFEIKNGKLNIKYLQNNVLKLEKDLNLNINIGDNITDSSSCKLSKHYENFDFNGKTYNDVIKIDCPNSIGYYQNSYGLIMKELK